MNINKSEKPLTFFYWHYVTILVSALIGHGLLLLNDGIYWDGWLIHSYLIEKDWSNLYTMFREGGHPATACFHWCMGYFPDIVLGYKLIAFVAIVLSGMLVYEICKETGLTTRLEGLFIALLSLVYPAYQTSIELIITPAVVRYCLFLLACLLAFRSERSDGFSRFLLRICSLLSFTASFGLNSLLVFYFGFLLLLTICSRNRSELSIKSVFTSFLPRHADFVFLPFLYWALMQHFFPRLGVHADYYQFRLSLSSIISHSRDFIGNAVYAQLRGALADLAKFPVLWFLLLVFVQRVYVRLKSGFIRFFERGENPSGELAFGLVLLVLGILPYVVIGKAPSVHGWSTRHALLMGLPMAVVIVAVARLVFLNQEFRLSRLGLAFLVTLIVAFCFSTIANYVSWQARWVKDRSIMVNLSEISYAKEISVFWVDDQFPVGGESNYRYYEWASIFKSIWGDESRIGLDQRVDLYTTPNLLVSGKSYFNREYNLSDFDPAGPQGILTISPGFSSYTHAELAVRYLFYKLFRKGRLHDFLLGVTNVQVKPVLGSEIVRYRLGSVSPGSPVTIRAAEAFNGRQNTLAAWVRLEQEFAVPPLQVLFSYYEDSENRWTISIRESGTQLGNEFFCREGYVWLPVSIDWQAGEWHHLVYVLDFPRYIALYVDGQYVSRVSIDGDTVPSWEGVFSVGSLVGGDYPVQVQISELATYARALSLGEIEILYVAQSGQYQPE